MERICLECFNKQAIEKGEKTNDGKYSLYITDVCGCCKKIKLCLNSSGIDEDKFARIFRLCYYGIKNTITRKK